MAKFTAGVPLNIRWQGHAFIGAAGTTHRVTDALVEEFVEEVTPGIPGFAWVTQDELTSVVTLPIGQTDVTGLTAALAAKYDKTGGIISGAASVTGAFVAQASATVAGSLAVQNNANVTNTVTASTLALSGAATIDGAVTVTGVLTAKGAVNASSTLGVTGKATLLSSLAFGGTSFPGSPADNDIYYRTDLDLLFFYDGTRWLSVQLFRADMGHDTAQSLAATQAGHVYSPAPKSPGSDIWLVELVTRFDVVGGTALSGSHKWVGTWNKIPTDNSDVAVKTVTIDSGSSSVWRIDQQSIGALMNNGTEHFAFRTGWVKTGTPGTLFAFSYYTYRIVAT